MSVSISLQTITPAKLHLNGTIQQVAVSSETWCIFTKKVEFICWKKSKKDTRTIFGIVNWCGKFVLYCRLKDISIDKWVEGGDLRKNGALPRNY
jgi:predicted metal-binding transcription factor (methanogenesis marker protein 9)